MHINDRISYSLLLQYIPQLVVLRLLSSTSYGWDFVCLKRLEYFYLLLVVVYWCLIGCLCLIAVFLCTNPGSVILLLTLLGPFGNLVKSPISFCVLQADLPGVHGQCAFFQASAIPHSSLPRDPYWIFGLRQTFRVCCTSSLKSEWSVLFSSYASFCLSLPSRLAIQTCSGV